MSDTLKQALIFIAIFAVVVWGVAVAVVVIAAIVRGPSKGKRKRRKP
jgi:NADH:ubiquinone oxidoreductase subunit 3 (subunit A)